VFGKTLVLSWYLVGSRVSEDVEIREAIEGGVNERSNGDKIIFKHCKREINSRQHNDK
jgi:hypothetical protein